MSINATAGTFDAHLSAIGHVDRRRLLLALLARPADARPVDVERVADETGETRAVAMYHVHVPKLAALGLVEVDESGSRVRRGPRFDDIVPLLELLDANRTQLSDGWL